MKRGACAITAALFGVLATHGEFAFAQPQTAASSDRVAGVARDALQRPLEGVQIRLESPEGKLIAQGRTQKDGRFTLSGVAPGVYSLIGDKAGFTSAMAIVTVGAKGAASDLTLASVKALDLQVTAQQLAAARSGIEPRIGATTYTTPMMRSGISRAAPIFRSIKPCCRRPACRRIPSGKSISATTTPISNTASTASSFPKASAFSARA